MCGICGWIDIRSDRDYRPARINLAGMSATIEHRGPDDWGKAEFKNAALAMTRLSIIDVEGGRQPIFNEDKSCSIVFNGEIYNFKELRRELKGKGARFRTRSDTEVVLRAYEEWGDDCLDRLRGMFALAIYDSRPKKNGAVELQDERPRLLLARDRVGKKPLYYYRDEDRIIFGSEIKGILANSSVKARVRRGVLPLYLSYGYVPAPYTFFENIFELPPAHRLAVENGEVKAERYWEPPPQKVVDLALSEKQYIERLRELLEEAVRVRLVSDVPVGAFLSGGVDSAAVVAFMTRITKQPVQTFAIGFTDDPSFNELEHARTVANYVKSDHREFMVSPDAIDLLPKLVWHYDQPFADSSAIPSFLVARMTREHVKVALTGDGADELFAGYERFAAARLARTYSRAPRLLQNSVKRLLNVMSEATTYRSAVRRARRFVDSAALPLAERYLNWVGIFSPSLINELLTAEIESDPVSHFQSYFDSSRESDLIGQLLSVNMKTYLPGDLLVKTDRMTMANSLEARSPFLDHELLEFSCSIPSELKLKGMTTKYILKRVLEGIVPKEIIHRKKHGFGVPVGRWFRSSLKRYLHETLLSPQALRRGYFHEPTLRHLIEEHQSGKRDHGHRLWALLTLEIWHRIFIDQESSWRSETLKRESRSFASLAG
ncbi:MAG TPA: asparagine synthase (glutamine-hydrolyzing) [Candidatus Binatia bacterium]|nr:asparagine synthase (glutamine-hydrolyzing) [Candidatus Binatia bacterium]